MLTKFACANFAVKFSATKLLNSWVVIYLIMIIVRSILFSISLIFSLHAVLLNKLLTLGISISSAVRAVVVAKLVIIGVLPLISFILALKATFAAKLVKLGIALLTSFILALRVVLLILK